MPGYQYLRQELHASVLLHLAGLTKKQVERMTGKWFVFMTLDGRISMAGLSAAKCPYLATAIADCVANA